MRGCARQFSSVTSPEAGGWDAPGPHPPVPRTRAASAPRHQGAIPEPAKALVNSETLVRLNDDSHAPPVCLVWSVGNQIPWVVSNGIELVDMVLGASNHQEVSVVTPPQFVHQDGFRPQDFEFVVLAAFVKRDSGGDDIQAYR